MGHVAYPTEAADSRRLVGVLRYSDPGGRDGRDPYVDEYGTRNIGVGVANRAHPPGMVEGGW
jgi:hypothetical protein